MQKNINPKSVYNSANIFYNASELLGREVNGPEFAIPWIVNTAFALELYFKCLLVLEDKKINKIHLLAQLYGGISYESKASELIAAVNYRIFEIKPEFKSDSPTFYFS